MKPNSLFSRAERLIKSLVLGLMVAFALTFNLPSAQAAVPNIAVGSGQVVVVPLHITGAISATVTGISKFNMPFPCQLIGVSASSQAINGTTNTVDVKLGGVSVLSSAITIAAAGTVYEGTISTSTITDEGVITVDITIAGTSLTHTTVLLTCARR